MTETAIFEQPFKQQLDTLRQQVDRTLDYWLPSETTTPLHLHGAMRYGVVGGGKRVRPVLVYATGMALDIPLTQLNGPACAIELIHAYSLIHDDLPAMDDDDLRRGQPTCHKAYDEATAILAGDAIQALAFQVLAKDPEMTPDPAARIKMIEVLADAAGSQGMAGGQAIDLGSVNKTLNLEQLEEMHRHKTGALIKACVQLGCLSTTSIDAERQQKLWRYGELIGLAFQIQDDILDIISDTETLGKNQGADIALNKPTFPSLLGLEGAQKKAKEVHQEALECLQGFDYKADLLRNIANYIVERTY